MAIWQSNRRQIAVVRDGTGKEIGSYELSVLELVRAQQQVLLPSTVRIETTSGAMCELKKEIFLEGFDPLPVDNESETRFIGACSHQRQSDGTGFY